MLINATRNHYQHSKCGNSNLLYGAKRWIQKWQRTTGGGRFLHHWLNVQRAINCTHEANRSRSNEWMNQWMIEWRQKKYQQSSNKLFIECFPYQRQILVPVQVWLVHSYTFSFAVDIVPSSVVYSITYRIRAHKKFVDSWQN